MTGSPPFLHRRAPIWSVLAHRSSLVLCRAGSHRPAFARRSGGQSGLGPWGQQRWVGRRQVRRVVGGSAGQSGGSHGRRTGSVSVRRLSVRWQRGQAAAQAEAAVGRQAVEAAEVRAECHPSAGGSSGSGAAGGSGGTSATVEVRDASVPGPRRRLGSASAFAWAHAFAGRGEIPVPAESRKQPLRLPQSLSQRGCADRL